MRFGRSFQIRRHKLFIKRQSFAHERHEKTLKKEIRFFEYFVYFVGNNPRVAGLGRMRPTLLLQGRRYRGHADRPVS